MAPASDLRAVLFVDLTDSTRLYDTLGDSQAREYSSTAMMRWEEIVHSAQGRVVKRIGDELMCVFDKPEQAARAAMDIQVALDEGLSNLDIQLHAKAGLHAGPLLEEDGDIFGDTVNLAARMVALAKPGQILTTAQTAAVLPPFFAACARPRGDAPVKGKSGAFGIIELVWKAEEQTRQAEDTKTVVPITHRLRVRRAEMMFIVDAQDPVLRMGRHPHNELVIEGELVSRSHARIEHRKGRFSLIDESINGTWVHALEGGTRWVQQDEMTLPEAGRIGLGEEVHEDHSRAIHFRLEFDRSEEA